MRRTAVEILVQKLFELCGHVIARIASCNELAVIEPHTIIKQKPYIGSYEPAAMLVDRMFQLFVYLMQTFHYRMPLILGQMQSLIRLIGEKRIIPYFLAKRSALYQVRMKYDPVCGRTVSLRKFGIVT